MPDTSSLKDKLSLDLTIPGVDERQLPTNQFLMFSIVFIAIYFIVVFYFIYPEVKNISSQYNKLQRAEAELQKYQDRQKNVRAILNNDYYSEEMVTTIDNILYDTNPYVEVLLTINELADQYDLDVANLEYSPGIVATPSATLASRIEEQYPIKFHLSGSFGNIALFLQDLEMHAPFNSVSSVKISNSLAQGNASAQVEILAQFHVPEIFLTNRTIDASQDLPEISYPQQKALATLQKMIRKNFDLNQVTISESTPKINIFALNDLGVTLSSTTENGMNYFYDPTTGDLYTYTAEGVPVILSPEQIPKDQPIYEEEFIQYTDESTITPETSPTVIDVDPTAYTP